VGAVTKDDVIRVAQSTSIPRTGDRDRGRPGEDRGPLTATKIAPIVRLDVKIRSRHRSTLTTVPVRSNLRARPKYSLLEELSSVKTLITANTTPRSDVADMASSSNDVVDATVHRY
jgi:hypothetical protein